MDDYRGKSIIPGWGSHQLTIGEVKANKIYGFRESAGIGDLQPRELPDGAVMSEFVATIDDEPFNVGFLEKINFWVLEVLYDQGAGYTEAYRAGDRYNIYGYSEDFRDWIIANNGATVGLELTVRNVQNMLKIAKFSDGERYGYGKNEAGNMYPNKNFEGTVILELSANKNTNLVKIVLQNDIENNAIELTYRIGTSFEETITLVETEQNNYEVVSESFTNHVVSHDKEPIPIEEMKSIMIIPPREYIMSVGSSGTESGYNSGSYGDLVPTSLGSKTITKFNTDTFNNLTTIALDSEADYDEIIVKFTYSDTDNEVTLTKDGTKTYTTFDINLMRYISQNINKDIDFDIEEGESVTPPPSEGEDIVMDVERFESYTNYYGYSNMRSPYFGSITPNTLRGHEIIEFFADTVADGIFFEFVEEDAILPENAIAVSFNSYGEDITEYMFRSIFPGESHTYRGEGTVHFAEFMRVNNGKSVDIRLTPTSVPNILSPAFFGDYDTDEYGYDLSVGKGLLIPTTTPQGDTMRKVSAARTFTEVKFSSDIGVDSIVVKYDIATVAGITEITYQKIESGLYRADVDATLHDYFKDAVEGYIPIIDIVY